jgi:hypothetical protein
VIGLWKRNAKGFLVNGFEMQNKSSGSFLFWTGFSGQKNAKPGQGMVGQRVKMIVYGLVVAVGIGQKNARMPRARQG